MSERLAGAAMAFRDGSLGLACVWVGICAAVYVRDHIDSEPVAVADALLEPAVGAPTHLPPNSYRDDVTVLVRFADLQQVSELCGGQASGCRQTRNGEVTLVFRNPCEFVTDEKIAFVDRLPPYYTLANRDHVTGRMYLNDAYQGIGTQCHEIAHANGWNHADTRGQQ